MLFSQTNTKQINAGLLISRIIFGVIFTAHGWQKLFVWGPENVGAAFTQMGIPMASVVGPFIGALELVGGIAVILGVLTRLFSLGLAGTMLGAIFLAHLPNGFFAPNGIEFVLALFGTAVLLTLTGAGAYSVDNAIAQRRNATPPAELKLSTQRVA